MIPDYAFYVNPEKIIGDSFSLDKDESKHAIQVLRKKVGDKICLINGIGTGYFVVIDSVEKNQVFGSIKETIPELGENRVSLGLAPALIKRDRFELILEKATELGVNDIYPLALDRCVKKTLNYDRSVKIVTAASKQCRRSRFPTLHEPLNMESFLEMRDGKILSGLMGTHKSLTQLNLVSERPITVIIGPEGDFTKKEIEIMKGKGVVFFHLGERRLRAETAVLNSLSILNELIN
tara:strand:+ start:751 stop:1458 length:708 start_codon:yes stop_codon:yes gene_type:complete